MYKKTVATVLVIIALLLSPYVSQAQESQIPKEQIPNEENLAALKQKIESNPDDFDARFSYAKMASALGKNEVAAETYKYMLDSDPSLNRVKLDLGLLYQRMGRYNSAKELYLDVLKSAPPEGVKKSIVQVLDAVNEVLKVHKFSGSVATGFNRDSNATASASSGLVLFLDNPIPLDEGSLRKKDSQVFITGTINHSYRFDTEDESNLAVNWNSSATAYSSEQATQDDLNLMIISGKTGPTFAFKKQGVKLSVQGGYSYTVLNDVEYLKTTSGEATASKTIGDRMMVTLNGLFEGRIFENSPTISTFEDRNGEVYQAKLAWMFALTDKDSVGADISLRREETKVVYLDNEQFNIAGSYTRTFPYDVFFNAIANKRTSRYDGPDPLISTTVRADDETGGTLTLGKKLRGNVSITVGYQYRNVKSNIQNYDFINQRFSSSLIWNF